jgi:primosomal protein N'
MLRTIFKVHKKAELVNPTAPLRDRIKKAMTLPNPEYVEAVKHGRWTGGMSQELIFYKDTGEAISFLRGYARTVAELLRQEKASFDIEDRRRELQPVHFQFKGELRDYQKQAVNAALERDHGVLEAATGSGKTVMAIATIAARKQPTIILVHTKELLHQWCDRIKMFLGIDPGIVGAGKLDIKHVTVAHGSNCQKTH